MFRIVTALIASAAVASIYLATPSFAQSCKANAEKQKLAGAALKSFMTKCEREAATACDTRASEQKLAGAAKNSFTKKCVNEAVGN